MLQRASILAEQVKPILATLTSHLEVPVQAPATALLMQLPAIVPGKSCGGCLRVRVLPTGSFHTWLQWARLEAGV